MRRGYAQKKITENVEAEIMQVGRARGPLAVGPRAGASCPRPVAGLARVRRLQVVLDEAREAYAEEIVIELTSNCIEDLESNVSRALQWMESWAARQKDQ